MFFEKKLNRSFETSKYLGDQNTNFEEEGEPVKLEKKDRFAILISALVVFGPIFAIIGLLAFLLTL